MSAAIQPDTVSLSPPGVALVEQNYAWKKTATERPGASATQHHR